MPSAIFFVFGHSSKHPKHAKCNFFLHLASNFQCQKLEVERKKNCIGPSTSFQAWSSKALKHAEHKLFCIKSWMLNANFFVLAFFETPELGA
jgi:hypothetical protein